MDENFIGAILGVLGRQVTREGGIDFGAFLNISQMKLLREQKNGGEMVVYIYSVIGHSIMEGTKAAISGLNLETKYKEAAQWAL